MAKGSTESKGKRLILQLYRGIQTYISYPALVSYGVLTAFSISPLHEFEFLKAETKPQVGADGRAAV